MLRHGAMSFIDRIGECNAHDLAGFRPFVVAGARVGWVRHALAERFARFARVFTVRDDAIELDRRLDSFESRSAAMVPVVDWLEAEGLLTGRRDEFYPVATSWGARPLLRLERAAVPRFGVRAWGVHMTGFVRTPDGIAIWVPRRARDRPTYPGMLDNTVAGGQPIGLSFRDNLVKECGEEAGIPPDLARRAVSVGAIAYRLEAEDGLKPDVQICFDLELPPDFAPRAIDGEIESFALLQAAEVMRLVRDTSLFKFNCNLVLIDFFVRHGLIGPEDPDYVAICRGLRR